MPSKIIRHEKKGGRLWPPAPSIPEEIDMSKTVKVRALRPMHGIYGDISVGQVVEVSETHAKRFVQRGMAELAGKAEASPKNKMEGSPANKAAANPRGQTGAAKQSSSSPAGQAPKTSTSKSAAAKPAS